MYKLKVLLTVLLCLLPALAYAQDVPCPDLTLIQRWAGYLSWMGLLYTIGAGAIGLGILFVFGGVIMQVVVSMRYILEIVAYALCAGAIAMAWHTDPAYQLPYLMAACIGFGGCIFLSIWLHDIKGDDPRGVMAILMVVWGIVAILFNELAVGFLSVGALMGVIGFSIGVGPGYYAFGFQREDAMPRATTTAYLLLAAFVAEKLLWPGAPAWVNVFAPGAFWLGSFVAFTGMLIMSFDWYCGRQVSYIPMQVVTVVTLAVALSIGLVFDIVPLPGMAGTFLVLFFASKSLDYKWESAIGIGFALIFSGGVLVGSWHLATSNPVIAKHFLSLVH